MKTELTKIKMELNTLLRKNQQSEDLERLERDEFCLDTGLRDTIMSNAEAEELRIRKATELKNLKEEIYHNKIQHLTYKSMDIKLKTITGFVENTVVFNFVIKKKDKAIERKLKMLKNMRFIELREKDWKKENKVEQYINLRKMTKKPIKYIVNAFPGKQDIILLDHAKREEERQQIKMMASMENDDKRNQTNPDDMTDRPPATGYRLRRQKRHQRKQKKLLGV